MKNKVVSLAKSRDTTLTINIVSHIYFRTFLYFYSQIDCDHLHFSILYVGQKMKGENEWQAIFKFENWIS